MKLLLLLITPFYAHISPAFSSPHRKLSSSSQLEASSLAQNLNSFSTVKDNSPIQDLNSLNPDKDDTPAQDLSLSADSSLYEIKLISPYKRIEKGKPFLAGIQIKMAKDWYSYWSFPGDFGISPHIKSEASLKRLPLPRPERKNLRVGNKDFYSFIYKNEVLIPLEVFVPTSYTKDNFVLDLSLEWGLCKDICINKKTELSLPLKIGSHFQEDPSKKVVFDFWKNSFPQKAKAIQLESQFLQQYQVISFSFDSQVKCLDLFPQSSLYFSTKKPKLLEQTEKSCSFQVSPSSDSLTKMVGLFIYIKEGELQSSSFTALKQEKGHLLWFILMAFLGGLVLNFMPCVLPIIFLKFYNNLQIKALSRRKQLLLNGSYSAGVILSFLFLALIIFVAKKSGESLGWGFHLQSPLFVSLLALLFTLMGLYLLDSFSFIKSSQFSISFFKDNKVFSHFLTGVLSTTAASPCTVPFMASTVGFAFSRTYLEIFTIFFFLGLGLSFPYLLLSFFPQVFRYVPSPGRWSQNLKKLFSIPLFLTTLWLLSILYFQVELDAFLLILISWPLLIGAVFIQKLKLKPLLKKILTSLLILTLFSLLLLQTKPDHEPLTQKNILIDSNWENFDENEILYSQAQGKNSFIALGAKWCLTCQFNERIFKTKKFKALVEKHKIQLFYGDWTNKTDIITDFLERQGRQGVPFYIFYKGEEKFFIFPTLLNETSFLNKIEELVQ